MPQVQLKVTGLSSFGPRVLFVQVDLSPVLDDLTEDLNYLMEDNGIQVYDNRFEPHITLFRLREGMKGDDNRVFKLIDDYSSDVANIGSVMVNEVQFKKVCTNCI